MIDDAEFERLYGAWEGLDPAGAQRLMAPFPGPWWVVGGWAIEAFTGVARAHEDIDVVIFRRDLPAFLDLVRGRYDVWSAGAGAIRPVNEDWPEPHADAGQVWLREHASRPGCSTACSTRTATVSGSRGARSGRCPSRR